MRQYGAGVCSDGEYLLVTGPSLEYLDSHRLVCRSPPILVAAAVGIETTVGVSLDGVTFVSAGRFLFYPTPVIYSMHPTLSSPGTQFTCFTCFISTKVQIY
jgi:hypothetical protein